MGETEGSYRALQIPGTRLGAQTPAGVNTLEPGRGPLVTMAQTSVRAPEKRLHVRVKLLDGAVETFDVEPKGSGQLLLTQLWERLTLVECDYFGVEFQNVQSRWIWLEPMKPIVRQVRRPKNALLRLAVKFFPPDPGQLQEEYTRYLFALQLKRDLLEGRLTCSDTTAALLASHLLQSELGDYDETLDREHLRANAYLPDQERSLEKVLEFHQKHTGQTPAESDFQVLEVARKLEMYGIRFHVASDREGTKINLAVSHMGVLVFQGTTKINTFNWSKVRKLSFKRKRFLVKLHPEVHGPYQDTLEFLLGSRDECKNFWKICVEYHTFFRLLDQPQPKAKAIIFSRGSSFRYSGRTQKQLVDYVKDSGMKKMPYERRHSRTRMLVRAPAAEVPRQSTSFTESPRTPAALSPAKASFCSVPASLGALVGQPDSEDRGSSHVDPHLPLAKSGAPERSTGTSAGGPDTARPLEPLAPEACPGAGFCHAGRSCSPTGPVAPSSGASGPDAGRAGRECPAVSTRARGEHGLALGLLLSDGECRHSRPGGQGPALFTLTNLQLQVSEEFIDDDPAEVSFFGGGSEAFSCPYGSLTTQDRRGPALSPESPPLCDMDTCPHRGSLQSSPDRYSTEAVDMDVDDGFEFEEEGGCHGDVRPSDTCELFEVKAQASLMQSLLSASETSSLRNNRSESSSLSNVPLTSVLAGQSGASSLVNFPACSVRSEGSSAFHFSDILDQLEQLSCPPTATEASSDSDTDSWASEAEALPEAGLFFSSPFTQAPGERFSFDLQNNLQIVTRDERIDRNPY